MKKTIKVLFGTVFLICILLGLGYLGLAVYYENGFSFLTYINGIYCTGKTVESVNKELNESFDYEGLTVNLADDSFYIKSDEISYTYDYREPLYHYLTMQNPYLWIENLTEGKKEYTLQPSVSFNEAYLNEILDFEFLEQIPSQKLQVTLEIGQDGFYIYDNKKGLLDIAKAKKLIIQALKNGDKSVDLADAGCYYDEPYTDNEMDLFSFYELLDAYQCKKVAYVFDDGAEKFSPLELTKTLTFYNAYQNETIEKSVTCYTEYIGEDGKLLVNEEAISDLIDKKLKPYNTYHNHTFTTHDGRELLIKGGTYGNKIDMNTEKKELYAFLTSDKNIYTRIPKYTKEVSIKAKNDIGDTYIEVDIGMQKMFYYRDGELFLETDVVTGKNNATREEVCYVYAKQKNRILRGPGYESFVKYWMPVSGGIGIHDASWRDEYGGDIYIRNGSHGCINTPLEIVKEMYEVMEIGTPCILYYGLEEEEQDFTTSIIKICTNKVAIIYFSFTLYRIDVFGIWL